MKLVTDVALGKESSRTLNTNDDIRDYFESWGAPRRDLRRGADHLSRRTSFKGGL